MCTGLQLRSPVRYVGMEVASFAYFHASGLSEVPAAP